MRRDQGLSVQWRCNAAQRRCGAPGSRAPDGRLGMVNEEAATLLFSCIEAGGTRFMLGVATLASTT